MKEQHISYETAKLCKELGIDLPHTHYYIYPFRPAFKADGQLKKNAVPDDYHDTMLQVVRTRKNQPQIAPAYTKAFLQQYLRELPTPIIITPTTDFVVWEVEILHPDKGISGISKNKEEKWIDSYEEALEIGLYEGLNMVKLAK